MNSYKTQIGAIGMQLQQIAPFVRYARTNERDIMQGPLVAVDHRIFYCVSGTGQVEVAGKCYDFIGSSIIYIPAGVPYRFLFSDGIPSFAGCNFDFLQEHSHLQTPIPPCPSHRFLQEDILENEITLCRSGDLSVFSSCLYVQNMPQLENTFLELAQEYRTHSLYYDIRCSTLLKDILIQLARVVAVSKQGIPMEKVNSILHYIHTHYSQPLTNQELAKRFHYNENYISTLICKYTGLTLHRYVLNYKMHIAVDLFQATDLSVSEVAEKVGMPDLKHFSKCFKSIIGYPPSRFKHNQTG